MHIGEGASRQISQVLGSIGCSHPLIITDKMMVKLGYVTGLQASLSEAGISAGLFDDTVPEPTVSSIQAGVEQVRCGDYDCIIALGGGSPIDSAKAISILGKFGGSIRDYKEKKARYFQKRISTCPNSLRVLQQPQWTPTELEQNHHAVLRKLQEHYGFSPTAQA